MLCRNDALPQSYHPAKLQPWLDSEFFIYVCPRAVTCESREWALRVPGSLFFSTVVDSLYVASECLKQAQCDGGTELLIAFNLDYLKQRRMACRCLVRVYRDSRLPTLDWVTSSPLRGAQAKLHGTAAPGVIWLPLSPRSIQSFPNHQYEERKQILSTSVQPVGQCPAHSSA